MSKTNTHTISHNYNSLYSILGLLFLKQGAETFAATTTAAAFGVFL